MTKSFTTCIAPPESCQFIASNKMAIALIQLNAMICWNSQHEATIKMNVIYRITSIRFCPLRETVRICLWMMFLSLSLSLFECVCVLCFDPIFLSREQHWTIFGWVIAIKMFILIIVILIMTLVSHKMIHNHRAVWRRKRMTNPSNFLSDIWNAKSESFEFVEILYWIKFILRSSVEWWFCV